MPRSYKPPTEQTGQPYGEKKAERQATDAVPLPSREDRQMQAALESEPPTEGGLLGPPTEDEMARYPDTAGAPFGEGPGPEAVSVSPLQRFVNDDDAQSLARMLPLLERVASQPGASSATRKMVRQIRAEVVNARPGARL